jgi:uncharacterized membrane protein
MEPKKTKYDTNPLDPDFVKETDEIWGDSEKKADTQQVKGATREVGSSESPRANIYSEAPTRQINNEYPSVFVPPTYAPPPSVYQPPPNPYGYRAPSRPTSRPVAGIGLPEKWMMVLPYAPAYIGIVVSILGLLLVPRKESEVRFHAAQGLAVQLAIFIIARLFWVIGAVTDNHFGGTLFSIAATIFLVVSMLRVWRGEPHKIAPLHEPAAWFNEHIEPRNKS